MNESGSGDASTSKKQKVDQGISDDEFREILSSMSGWYDRHGYTTVLKVLYRYLVTEPDKLYAATSVMELFELLCASGHLSSTDPTVLYDTINVTKPFGLEPEINRLSVKTTFDIRTVIISKFTANRQRLIKVVESLSDSDLRKISKLYGCEQKSDRWELFVDLEHRGKICEENLDNFLRNVTTYLIIESNNDPLGLREAGKSNRYSIKESTSRKSTADDQGELNLTHGDTGTGDTEAGPSTPTDNVCMVNNMVQGSIGTIIGFQVVDSNITDSVINIYNNTIQLPATQGNQKDSVHVISLYPEQQEQQRQENLIETKGDEHNMPMEHTPTVNITCSSSVSHQKKQVTNKAKDKNRAKKKCVDRPANKFSEEDAVRKMNHYIVSALGSLRKDPVYSNSRYPIAQRVISLAEDLEANTNSALF